MDPSALMHAMSLYKQADHQNLNAELREFESAENASETDSETGIRGPKPPPFLSTGAHHFMSAYFEKVKAKCGVQTQTNRKEEDERERKGLDQVLEVLRGNNEER